ncbi:MAG: hypothetical protein GY753_18315 [Gammaproteobacteria bacterium]|nr:hypothetical protein [Gammaproteobacteria bacterium]
MASDGSVDRLHEQYPATDVEALAPNTLDKRIPPMWLNECDDTESGEIGVRGAPPVPGLTIYSEPKSDRSYVIGADPAEGNPQSDESAAVVVDADTGDQVAVLAGRFEPTMFGVYVDRVGAWCGAEGVLVERNNHGHAVLAYFANDGEISAYYGPDGKAGYLSNAKGKKELYAEAAGIVRDEQPEIRDDETYVQLASIEGSSLRAPDGMGDDRADAWALAQYARRWAVGDVNGGIVLGEDVIEGMSAVF